MNTRKYPRTLEQAFGPYERSSQQIIHPPFQARDRYYWADRALFATCCLALATILLWS